MSPPAGSDRQDRGTNDLILPPSHRRCDTSLREGGSLPLWGPLRAGGTLPSGRPSRQARRCHACGVTEGILAERSRRGDKIPAGGSPEEFSCPARSRAPPPAPSHAQTLCEEGSALAREGEKILYISFQRGYAPLEPPWGREWGKTIYLWGILKVTPSVTTLS